MSVCVYVCVVMCVVCNLSESVCLCVHVCMCPCACPYAWPCVYAEVRGQLSVLFYILPNFLRQGFSLNLELTVSARLPDQRVPGILLPPSLITGVTDAHIAILQHFHGTKLRSSCTSQAEPSLQHSELWKCSIGNDDKLYLSTF